MFECLAGLDQRLDGGVDFAVTVERRFQKIVVEPDAERLQVEILLVSQICDRELPDRFKIVDVAAGRDGRTVAGGDGFFGEKIGRDVADIITVVSRFRPAGGARLQTPGACLHRARERGDLHAGVVVIELARDVVTLAMQQGRQGIAERTLASVADVQRAGRIGGNEFDQHLLADAERALTVMFAVAQDRLDDVLLGRGR